ncbi:hypothetical protein BKA81DRAFT_366190 [Phyllosticta paracitricarpa]
MLLVFCCFATKTFAWRNKLPDKTCKRVDSASRLTFWIYCGSVWFSGVVSRRDCYALSMIKFTLSLFHMPPSIAPCALLAPPAQHSPTYRHPSIHQHVPRPFSLASSHSIPPPTAILRPSVRPSEQG